MAYQFCDSFDHYNTATSLYELVNGGNSGISYSSAYRRFTPAAGLPGQGIKIATAASYVQKNLLSSPGTLIIFLAVNFNSLGNAGTAGNRFIGLYSSGLQQCWLTVRNDGALCIMGSSTGLQVASATGLVTPGIWYGIEVEITVSASVGVAKVWLSGTQIINATGLNTSGGGATTANQVAIGDIANTNLIGMLMDDFRVWDTTGSTQNAPMTTDRQLITKLPIGAGDLTQWTPNGVAANWQCVDENPPDSDTTYVSSASTLLDSYAMPVAGFTAAPSMVVARSYARKDDGAVRTLETGVRSAGVNGLGSAGTMQSGYLFFDNCIALDPNTSSAWTAAAADAAQHLKFEAS